MQHAYPRELAEFVLTRWPAEHAAALPARGVLVELLSTAYQATLLREEERPVTFRLMLCEPASIPADAGPPDGLQRLELTEARPYTEHELRRLSPAAKYARSLVGVRVAERGGDAHPEIWGIAQSGPRWLQGVRGGRGVAFAMPNVLVVRATAPGRLVVACGAHPVAELRGGYVTDLAMDIFGSQWLPARFAASRAEVARLHDAARGRATEPWAELDPRLSSLVAQQMLKRVVSTIAGSRHGGTLVVLQPELDPEHPVWKALRFKYAFRDDAPRRRYRALILEVLATTAALFGRESRVVSWDDYRRSAAAELTRLDEATFELANLISELADVDGAVVLTKRFELLGFAAEIVGDLPEVRTVRRAVDLEADNWEEDVTDGVGTRHRSLYRFCERFRDATGVVVSQDGGVRFVAWKDGGITTWDHVALGGTDA